MRPSAEENAQLRARSRRSLAERLITAQQQLEAGNSSDDSARRQELQRRFEMAVQDLRGEEQKERNVALGEPTRLQGSRRAGRFGPAAAIGNRKNAI